MKTEYIDEREVDERERERERDMRGSVRERESSQAVQLDHAAQGDHDFLGFPTESKLKLRAETTVNNTHPSSLSSRLPSLS